MDRLCRAGAPLAGAIALVVAGIAFADEATGKVVWHDKKNSSLLLECADKGCQQIPDSKPGETYTFVVPKAVKKHVDALKEGQTIRIVYDNGKEKGYLITAVHAQ